MQLPAYIPTLTQYTKTTKEIDQPRLYSTPPHEMARSFGDHEIKVSAT